MKYINFSMTLIVVLTFTAAHPAATTLHTRNSPDQQNVGSLDEQTARCSYPLLFTLIENQDQALSPLSNGYSLKEATRHSITVNGKRYNQGLTPLMFATANGLPDTAVWKMLNYVSDDDDYKDYLNAQDSTGRTALHYAVAYNHDMLVRLLLYTKVQVDAGTNTGITPLHIASYNGNLTVVQELIRAGADVNACVRKGLLRPLDLAIRNGRTDVAHALKYAGAECQQCGIALGMQTCTIVPVDEEMLQGTTAVSSMILSDSEEQKELEVIAFLASKRARVGTDDSDAETDHEDDEEHRQKKRQRTT